MGENFRKKHLQSSVKTKISSSLVDIHQKEVSLPNVIIEQPVTFKKTQFDKKEMPIGLMYYQKYSEIDNNFYSSTNLRPIKASQYLKKEVCKLITDTHQKSQN